MSLFAAAAVLVELFTSEGCSSCPPADAALARLQQTQPVPGVQLIVLAEHVDYWNDLGWKDPFSAAQFSARQGLYGSRIYTPQAIVDGRTDVLGSDEEGIARAARSAALEPHGALALTAKAASVPGVHLVHIAVTSLPPHRAAQVMLAVVEDGLVTKVERGENAGRTLPHSAVVRSLKEVGTIPGSTGDWSADVEVPQNASWKRTRIVAFVQDGGSPRVLAAGSL
ncbi:MAG TPA: DUF1223 domain-containing protein [Myxococcales bacterium]|jgi:hypothetical protein|nr:DUF1223 domain-containing protein [Myxococcales bacterium]